MKITGKQLLKMCDYDGKCLMSEEVKAEGFGTCYGYTEDWICGNKLQKHPKCPLIKIKPEDVFLLTKIPFAREKADYEQILSEEEEEE